MEKDHFYAVTQFFFPAKDTLSLQHPQNIETKNIL